MAIRNKSDLKAEVAAWTALLTIEELQSVLTDILDSFGVGTNLYPCPLTSDLVAGSNARAHNLYISIFNVFVVDSGRIHKPDFELIDDQNITITWVGDTLSAPQIYYLSTT